MSEIKRYIKVDKGSDLDFRISKTEDIFDNSNGEPDSPHRHDYYTVIITDFAKGIHVIDFNEFELNPNQVHFVAPGQVHQVIDEKRPNGYVLVFSQEFLIKNNIPEEFINDLNLFHDFGYSPPLEIDSTTKSKIFNYCIEIECFYQSDKMLKQQAIGSLLKLILIECNNSCDLEFDTQTHQAGQSLLKRFKELLELNYKKEHKALFYSEKLYITPDHLNRTIKLLTGKTSKEYIQSRIILAAKRLILFSDMTIKEIGYDLGFSDPGNFSAFFKNCTGYPISDFKRSLQP